MMVYPPRPTGLFDTEGTFIDEGDTLECMVARGGPTASERIAQVVWNPERETFFYGEEELTASLIRDLGLEVVASVPFLLEEERGGR